MLHCLTGLARNRTLRTWVDLNRAQQHSHVILLLRSINLHLAAASL